MIIFFYKRKKKQDFSHFFSHYVYFLTIKCYEITRNRKKKKYFLSHPKRKITNDAFDTALFF